MRVIRLVIAYDGTDFHGWARQRGVRTVEGVVREALDRVLRTPPRLSVAGRTDAGVHAWGQVVSFPAPDEVDPKRVRQAVNGMLAPEVVVRSARRVPEDFDARHSATAREYLYRVDTAAVPSPFSARWTWHHPGPLRVGPMRRAAAALAGEHDFASFCRAPQRGGTVRNLLRLSVSTRGEEVRVRARANGFLHQMVRSLVGTLVRVGEGRLDPDAVAGILGARDRAAAGSVAPPQGLTLMAVRYASRS
ncbi:MAG TPA: tRNA pseudouridine(38-40) synthase TruA [Actinomycetota bacterium]|nr:tRNA pseudouridine(38-40) synthase TruA [Actinomycetota bacterium]